MSSIVIYTDYSLGEKRGKKKKEFLYDFFSPPKVLRSLETEIGEHLALHTCIYMNEHVDLNTCNVYICIYMHIYIHLIYIYTHIHIEMCIRCSRFSF